jgi:hypothetical protein
MLNFNFAQTDSERIRRIQARRIANAVSPVCCCVECGGQLYGRDDSIRLSQEDAGFLAMGLKAGDPFCFWCWDEWSAERDDPSRNSGRC